MRLPRAAVVACLLVPGLAAASPFHAAVRGGALVPTELDRFGTGFAVELAGGWQATPSLALELAVGRKTIQGPGGFQDPEGSPVTTRLTLFPVTATVRWAFWRGDFRPYLLAGAGVEITRVRPAIRAAGEGPLATPATHAALLLQGGAGIVYQLDVQFAFGLEGRFVRARSGEGGAVAADGVLALAAMEYRY